MKVVILLFAFAAVSYAEVSPENTAYDYHRRFGIPWATKLKQHEDDVASNPQRIVGGSTVSIAEVPYQVGLLVRFLYIINSACGGALISHHHVLTAAHCHNDGVLTAQRFTVVLGSNTIFNGGTRINTINARVHPSWNPRTAENDIAVLWINYVTFDEVIQPINLPTDAEYFDNLLGVQATISGYGINRDGGNMLPSQVLHKVEVPIVHNDVCRSSFGDMVHDASMCTSGFGGKSPCDGDSGGPLAIDIGIRKFIVGVFSLVTLNGCEQGGPASYTNVKSHLAWINSVAV